jgi:alkanesulfonate monooxygenase SsuD/methylene tetrahydromethanopterin reductase-like flavin-dependent oxidoreductase (luciferase family)
MVHPNSGAKVRTGYDRWMARLHLGLTPWVGDLAAYAHEIAGQAEHAESLGYHSLWLPESHFIDRGACPSPLLPLAAAAARTTSLKLGTTSYLLPVRHPIHVAEELAVLDRISQGRLIVGLGRGFRRALFDVFDVPVKEKRKRFEASLQLILKAWAGDPVANGGDGIIRLAPLPVQEPHPPLWVAAFGPKAVRQAGRLGLPYLASPIESFERLRENYALHRDTLLEHDHRKSIAVPIMRTVFISEDPSVLRAARSSLDRQAAELAKTPAVAFRTQDSKSLDDWALTGGPAEVSEAIHKYRETLGMTHLIARGHIPRMPPADLLRSLELLAGLGL